MNQTIAVVGPGDRQVEQLLRGRGLTVVSWMERDLATRAQQASPAAHYVMIDLRDQPRLPPSLEAFCRQHPSVPVLLLVSSLDPALMLEAMRAGVKECLQYPVHRRGARRGARAPRSVHGNRSPAATCSPSSAPREASARRRPPSTSPPTLAVLHAGSVLLVDLHLAYGDAAIYLGAEPRFSIADALENTHRLDARVPQEPVREDQGRPRAAGVAGPAPGAARGRRPRAHARRRRGPPLPYVVLDLCRTDPAVLDGLDSVKKIVVIANQELATVRGGEPDGGDAEPAVRQGPGRGGRQPVRPERRDRPGATSSASSDPEIRHLLPSDYRVALEALNTGRPLALEQPDSAGGRRSRCSPTIWRNCRATSSRRRARGASSAG